MKLSRTFLELFAKARWTLPVGSHGCRKATTKETGVSDQFLYAVTATAIRTEVVQPGAATVRVGERG
jgi:hypothetical protein